MDFQGQSIGLEAFSHPYAVVDPRGPAPYSFFLKTDNSGKVKLELGNVCEKFESGNIAVLDYKTTYLSPNVSKQYSEKLEVYEFKFYVSIGVTSIEWGVVHK